MVNLRLPNFTELPVDDEFVHLRGLGYDGSLNDMRFQSLAGDGAINDKLATATGDLYVWDFSTNRFTDVDGTAVASDTDLVARADSTGGVTFSQSTSGARATANADGLIFNDGDYYTGSGALTNLYEGIGDNTSAYEIRMVLSLGNVSTNQYVFTLFNTEGASNNHEVMYLRVQSGGVLRWLYEDVNSVSKNITTTGSNLQTNTVYAIEFLKDGEDATLNIYEDGVGLVFSKDGTFNNGDFTPNLFTLGGLGRSVVNNHLLSNAEIHSFEVELL